ncbi:MAG: hypothetical protein ACKVOW_11035 [Chitinophagaceae bacterium]
MLFLDEIEQLNYPEIKEFLIKHVDGSLPIPYEKYFEMAGVAYICPEKSKKISTFGEINISGDSGGKLIVGTATMNEFGKKMWYKDPDEITSINGVPATLENIGELINSFYRNVKDGDSLTVVAKRKF